MMNTVIPSHPALEEALRAGAELSCRGEELNGGMARIAFLGRDRELLAVGLGRTFPESLDLVEADIAVGGPAVKEFLAAHCDVCALNHMASSGVPDAVSALDDYLLGSNRGFAVRQQEDRLHFRAHWWRSFHTPKALKQRVVSERVTIHWRHGEYRYVTAPVQGKTKWLPQTKTTARPIGAKLPYPCEERCVEAVADTLPALFAAADQPIAAAVREDAAWHSLLEIVSCEIIVDNDR